MMQDQLSQVPYDAGVSKLLSLLVVHPTPNTPQPIHEDALLTRPFGTDKRVYAIAESRH